MTYQKSRTQLLSGNKNIISKLKNAIQGLDSIFVLLVFLIIILCSCQNSLVPK
jgi:hypothetical protein